MTHLQYTLTHITKYACTSCIFNEIKYDTDVSLCVARVYPVSTAKEARSGPPAQEMTLTDGSKVDRSPAEMFGSSATCLPPWCV